MNQDLESLPRLAELEREVVAQAREWGRRRLQELADQSGEGSSSNAGIWPCIANCEE